MSLKVKMTQVGEGRLTRELQGRFNTMANALLAVRSHCWDIFKDHNFSFEEVTCYVFMIVRDGENAGLIIMSED